MPTLTGYPSSNVSDNSEKGASAILRRRDVLELQELARLRRQGWGSEQLDRHFKTQRETSDNATEQAERAWFHNMRRIMGELDTVANVVPLSKKLEFLDVGCAPGGFSSYVLRKNHSAKGTGISLPESAGGHPMLLENHLRRRYQHLQEDLLEYDCSPVPLAKARKPLAQRLPETFIRNFSIVILDGHALRTYRHPFDGTPDASADMLRAAHGAYSARLLITQIIIALQSIALGGTIVMRLSHIECFPALPLLYLLDAISSVVVVHKPQTMHKARGTSYVVAKGVFSSRKQVTKGMAYLRGLQTLWSEIQRDGPYDSVGRMLVEGDLDFIASAETLLDEYVDRLVELGRQTWATQVDGLRTLFKRRGIRVVNTLPSDST